MPVLGKPATVRSLIVTWFASVTQIPFTSVQAVRTGSEGGVSTVPSLPDPAPRSVMPSVVIVRFSRNSPAATRIVSPGRGVVDRRLDRLPRSHDSVRGTRRSDHRTTPSEPATTPSTIANVRGHERMLPPPGLFGRRDPEDTGRTGYRPQFRRRGRVIPLRAKARTQSRPTFPRRDRADDCLLGAVMVRTRSRGPGRGAAPRRPGL